MEVFIYKLTFSHLPLPFSSHILPFALGPRRHGRPPDLRTSGRLRRRRGRRSRRPARSKEQSAVQGDVPRRLQAATGGDQVPEREAGAAAEHEPGGAGRVERNRADPTAKELELRLGLEAERILGEGGEQVDRSGSSLLRGRGDGRQLRGGELLARGGEAVHRARVRGRRNGGELEGGEDEGGREVGGSGERGLQFQGRFNVKKKFVKG